MDGFRGSSCGPLCADSSQPSRSASAVGVHLKGPFVGQVGWFGAWFDVAGHGTMHDACVCVCALPSSV